MNILSQLLFAVATGVAVFLFARQAGRIRANILLGKEEDFSDQPALRWKNMLLLAFGQKKMFSNPFVAVMHLIIYVGFVIINLEVLEILIDGLAGTHRIFAAPLGKLYPILINCFEWLALGVLVTCVIFLCRRNLVKIKRFQKKELEGWPKTDANFILVTEIILMSLFLTMNATDTILQDRAYGSYGGHLTGDFSVSVFLKPLFINFSSETLVGIERTAWWLHILGIFAFLNYLPHSKHLHILLAFPNAYYARLAPSGEMRNMPAIQQEVLFAMQPELAAQASDAPPAQFGAKDVMDLSWRNLLDAYSCTECGRCSAECPANQTGKLLSPRKIMMDTRDRLEEVGRNIRSNDGKFVEDGKSLLHHYITPEELRACTTCNACVEACPVSINPLEIILELRRSLVMEESNAPQEWNMMFGNIENNFAPWKFSPDDRDKWAQTATS